MVYLKRDVFKLCYPFVTHWQHPDCRPGHPTSGQPSSCSGTVCTASCDPWAPRRVPCSDSAGRSSLGGDGSSRFPSPGKCHGAPRPTSLSSSMAARPHPNSPLASPQSTSFWLRVLMRVFKMSRVQSGKCW